MVAYPSLYKMKEVFRGRPGWSREPDMLCAMVTLASWPYPVVPLASASGYAVVGGTVVFALVLLRLLLRMEARDTKAADERQEADVDRQPRGG